jgi:Arc/MetJ-type ribon-helix-helix transcriptional regulator
MAAKLTTTIRLDRADVQALARARADGHSASDLVRRGLRLVGAKYYRGKRRPPTTRLFTSVDPKLGDEAELFGESSE